MRKHFKKNALHATEKKHCIMIGFLLVHTVHIVIVGRLNLHGLLLGADRAFGVDRCIGVEHPLSQINKSVVPVANGQALGLEEDAGLAVVGDAERAIGSHQRLEQLPLAERHTWMVPIERL